MHAISTRIRSRKPKIADSTVTMYARNVLRLKRISSSLDPKILEPYLAKQTPGSAELLATTLVVFLDDGASKDWAREQLDKYHKVSSDQRDLQRLTDKEAQNWTDVRTIRAALRRMGKDIETRNLFTKKTLRHRDYRLLLGYVCLRIHDEYHLRADLPTMQIYKTEKEADGANAYILDRNELILYTFKTSPHFKRRKQLPIRLRVSRKLHSLIKRFHDRFGHFVCWMNGKRLTKRAYRDMLYGITEEYMGVRLGPTMLRHIYLTYFLRGNPTLKARKQKLYDMQQLNLETQFRYDRHVKVIG